MCRQGPYSRLNWRIHVYTIAENKSAGMLTHVEARGHPVASSMSRAAINVQ